MAKKWKKIEANPTWEFDKEKEITGVYLYREENVGPNNSNLYSLERSNGSIVGIWGNTMLDDRFKSLKFGQEIKIVYLGKIKSEKSNREYNNFEIYTADDESEVAQEPAQLNL